MLTSSLLFVWTHSGDVSTPSAMFVTSNLVQVATAPVTGSMAPAFSSASICDFNRDGVVDVCTRAVTGARALSAHLCARDPHPPFFLDCCGDLELVPRRQLSLRGVASASAHNADDDGRLDDGRLDDGRLGDGRLRWQLWQRTPRSSVRYARGRDCWRRAWRLLLLPSRLPLGGVAEPAALPAPRLHRRRCQTVQGRAPCARCRL